jgi:hypothetical protein
MSLLSNLGHALRTYRTVSVHSHAYWGHCSHCQESTPWFTNAWTGEYRCTRCQSDQLRDATD